MGGRACFIQIIDFLRIRKRPQKERYLSGFLEVTGAHRQNLAEQLGDDAWRDASESEVRARLLILDDETLDAVLDRRETEALRYGFRERVTDVQFPHILRSPPRPPGPLRRRGGRAPRRPASTASSCTSRTRTPWPRSSRR